MFEPRFSGYEARVRDSFDRQPAMHSMGITISKVEPGSVELVMPYNPDFIQQHGFLHGGVIVAALDSTAGFSALTLMDEEAGVLSVEVKTSFLAPGKGDHFRFVGEVIKPGRNLVFVETRGYAISDGQEKLMATLNGTMMAVRGRDDVKD